MNILKPQKMLLNNLRKINNLLEEFNENDIDTLENIIIKDYRYNNIILNDITIKRAIINNINFINCNLDKNSFIDI